METTGKSHDLGKPILKLSWGLFMEYSSQNTFIWKSQEIQVKVHSFYCHGPGGHRVHFDFRYQGKDYQYGMLDTYMKGVFGSPPQIRIDDHWLDIKPRITSLEIHERNLNN
ncbi:MAG: hypothetical protein WCK92_08040 [Bacteroidota bacterium]